jgi:glycosyltransferase involved in cell wall biosynthesis
MSDNAVRERGLSGPSVEGKRCVSVLIPAYNEAGAIGPVIQAALRVPEVLEVIVADDHSTDGTAETAEAAGARVISHPYNIGNGAAVKTAARHARGRAFVTMDADGQHKPEDIPRLLEYIDRFDMVVGARASESDSSKHRDLANFVYNRFASYMTQFRVEDLTSGFRAVRRDVFLKFLPLLPNTFSYPTTLTLSLLRSGHTVKYVPIVAPRRTGKSKIKIFRDGARFFLILIKIGTLFSPMRVFLPVSVLLFLLGLINYVFTYVSKGRFTNMSALLFSTSVIVFMMGLVSEQIAGLRADRIEERQRGDGDHDSG